MDRYNKTTKAAAALPLVSKRLLNHIHERIRYLHYSLKIEQPICVLGAFLHPVASLNHRRNPNPLTPPPGTPAP